MTGVNRTTIVPSRRLIWLVGLLGFPALVVEAVLPQARGAAAMLIAVLFLVTIADALLRARALADLKIELPELLRLVQGRDAQVPVTIHNGGKSARRGRSLAA